MFVRPFVTRTFNISTFKAILVEADNIEPTRKDDNVALFLRSFAQGSLRDAGKALRGPSPEQLEYMKIPPLSASNQLHIHPEH